MSDPSKPEEMRALANIKQQEAEQHHARADDAGRRLTELLISKPDTEPCDTCGHVPTDADRDRQVTELRLEQRLFAGRGNAASNLAMFWRNHADRVEQASESG